MSCGIYQILNTITGKCYVGQAKNISIRLATHKRHLKRNGHVNRKLQNAWNKYGEEYFKFQILKEYSINLSWLEAFWMAKLDSVDNGYNISRITLDGVWLLSKHSEETKLKMRKPKSETMKEKMRNRVISKETREKLSLLQLGRKHSEERKTKNSDFRKGKKLSKEHAQKIGNKHRGMKRSKEARKNISLGHLGKPLSEEHKAKLREGKEQMSEETKTKMKQKMREAWAKRKQRLANITSVL